MHFFQANNYLQLLFWLIHPLKENFFFPVFITSYVTFDFQNFIYLVMKILGTAEPIDSYSPTIYLNKMQPFF